MACPVCSCVQHKIPRQELGPHPYVECSNCRLYYQATLNPKIYEAHHENPGNTMSEVEKKANISLAIKLIGNHLTKKLTPTNGNWYHFDIGSKYPYLGHSLQNQAKNLTSYGMDGIEEAQVFGQELGVKMFKQDFENDPVPKEVVGKIHLVTMVHCFEHMYKPLEAIEKIHKMLVPGGIFFIRSPDHEVPGVERDFTKGHYDIHPLIWCESAVLESLVQVKDKFIVEESYPINPGQRDYVLRKISNKPTIGVGYIVKNEERDLPASLESIKDVADIVCIKDTGSTDNTEKAALDFIHRNPTLELYYDTYTGASKKDEAGDWKLWDFAKARNKYVEFLEPAADWILWMDADDTVPRETAKVIKRIPYMPLDMHGFMIKTGIDGHVHHRMWRSGSGVKYVGACHEYPVWPDSMRTRVWENLNIVHNGADGVGESSILRNLRILEREPKNHRNLFYLANTYRDAYGIPANTQDQRNTYLKRAIETYKEYLSSPSTYWDESVMAQIYKARCERWLGDYESCLRTVREGIARDPSWAEFYMESCYLEQSRGNQWAAISWALQAKDIPFRKRLFSESNKYTDQPLRALCHSFNNLGNSSLALEWGRQVKKFVVDPSWEDFLKAIGDKPAININRPGALGDVIITGWLLKGLKEKHPGCEVVYYTKSPDAANLLADVDEVRDCNQWDNRTPGHDYVLTGYPIQEGYPKVPMRENLVNYFAKEAGVAPSTPSIKIPPLKSAEHYITVHVQAGWSTYKNWPIDRWKELLINLKEVLPEWRVIQIGGSTDPKIDLSFVEDRVGKTSIAETAQLIKHADLHLGVDSFTNHLAGVFRTPAVILFGSTSPAGSGYSHARNIWLGLKCSPCYKEDPKISRQSQGVCNNPEKQTYDNPQHACLHGLGVEDVFRNMYSYIKEVCGNMYSYIKENNLAELDPATSPDPIFDLPGKIIETRENNEDPVIIKEWR